MEPRRSIYKTVRTKALLLSLVSMLCVFALALGLLLFVRQGVRASSAALGQAAAKDSAKALKTQAGRELLALVQNRAELIDHQFHDLAEDTRLLAGQAESILATPGAYLPVDVPPPDPATTGKVSAQLVYASSGPPAAATEQAALLGNMRDLLVNLCANGDAPAEYYLGDETGFFLIANRQPQRTPPVFDPRGRPWYQDAKTQDALIWTEPFEDAGGRGLSITCAAPYHTPGGAFAGAVGTSLMLTEIEAAVEATRTGLAGFALLVDDQGRIVAQSAPRGTLPAGSETDFQTSDDPALAALRGSMLAGDEGVAEVTLEGKDCFVAYTPLESLPWSFAAIVAVDTVTAPARESAADIARMTSAALADMQRLMMIGVWAFILLIATAALVAVIAARHTALALTAPITGLREGVGRIAGGDLDHPIDDIHTGDEIESLAGSVNQMATELKEYIANLQRVTAERERTKAELDVATQIQASMLPCIFPPFPSHNEFDIYALMRPAREVGGDFYDFFFVDEDHLAVVIADVSDKGVPAALYMVIAKTLIKNSAQDGHSPAEVLAAVNNQLLETNDTGMFVTAFLGVFEISSRRLTYANAGHNPPLLGRAGGGFSWLPTRPGLVLAAMSDTVCPQQEVTLAVGDTLVLYTDGVTEAQNGDGAFFGADRLLQTLNDGAANAGPKALLDGLHAAVDTFAAGAEQTDDITMLALTSLREYGGERQAVLAAEVQNLPAAQGFVEEALAAWGWPQKPRTQLAIAVEEVFVNIAHYAYGGAGGTLELTARAGTQPGKGRYADVIFADAGPAFNPLEREDPSTDHTVEKDAGGLGIFMVKQLVDETEYRRENGRNIFRIRKWM